MANVVIMDCVYKHLSHVKLDEGNTFQLYGRGKLFVWCSRYSFCSAAFERKWLAKARDTLSHRGPDGKGEWWSDDRTIGLAHRRLSIFDLTSAADQPMHDPSSRFVIVFNGEIYNFPELKAELKSFGLNFGLKAIQRLC